MPKIKVKNIPATAHERICKDKYFCEDCQFNYAIGSLTVCVLNFQPNSKKIVELSEKDFPTNREWLESLSDEDLAAFYTLGIPLKDNSYISLYRVAMSFTSSQQGIKEWLSEPCKYLMEDEQ